MFHEDRRTDRHDDANGRFAFFSNAPKKKKEKEKEKKALLHIETPESVWCPLQLSAFGYQLGRPTLKPAEDGVI